ncbi:MULTISPECIES: hypothetical protein [unclassified Streptomyces]|uniref:hypothetical protein n=1 Tax=unclassified Streptomyces TaxID=2593676 RepID=UPI00224EA0A2|nr:MULTISPECIES: hypothetical protein [unclassified Streptomyces]WSP53334.1 hypothetical protein OG306_02115 [Streptomyces sp. NBC_01241]WSU25995.1 hypothetical protein OG508_37240 [Streptomyces sp. NBC_01108]MCX4784698.1 hypothetical protein [Streptomyces sp. NBC_01221]MCX4799346.1 hypothetical protein [Streptomyces sp. NBC_01242]WSJ40521.1 hypothetical protein OG772_34190 [Streptomyces sp. NBC_01321]
MATRSTVVTAAVAAAAALAATGITYASAATTEPAQAAPVIQQAAPAVQQAPAPVTALEGGDGGKGNEGKGNEGRGNEGRGNEGGGYGEGRGHEEGRRHYEGRIHINERTYSDERGGCITVVSGLGSKSLNIRNDSRRTVEVFRGATCDNGAPIATVGPHSSSDGVFPGHVRGGVWVKDGVVGSFRVIDHRFGGDRDRGDGDY